MVHRSTVADLWEVEAATFTCRQMQIRRTLSLCHEQEAVTLTFSRLSFGRNVLDQMTLVTGSSVPAETVIHA